MEEIVALLPIWFEFRKWRILELRSWFGLDKWELGRIGDIRVCAVFVFVGPLIVRFGLPVGDCGYACGYVEPYGFVPEAGCPVHDREP